MRHGQVRSDGWWHSTESTCLVGDEKDTLNVSCPGDGNEITSVIFADFGLAGGTCESKFAKDECSHDLKEKMEEQCVGKQSCSVMCDYWQCKVGDDTFDIADPCPGLTRTSQSGACNTI